MKIGQVGKFETVVTAENTAQAMGSGSMPVFATPAMAAAMEAASVDCVRDGLEEGSATVGTSLSLRHTAATPVGMRVTAVAELVAIEGRLLRFAVTASDEAGVIGQAEHERVIVQADRFLEKTNGKGRK